MLTYTHTHALTHGLWSPINSLNVFLSFTHWYYNSFEIKARFNEKKLQCSYQNLLPYKLDSRDESAMVRQSVCAQSLGPSKLPPKIAFLTCVLPSHSLPLRKFIETQVSPTRGEERRDHWARGLRRTPPLPFTLCVQVREPLRQSQIGFSVVQLGGAVGKI